MSKTEKTLIKQLINQFNLSPRVVLADWLALTTRYHEPRPEIEAFRFLQFCYRENNSMLAKYNFGCMRNTSHDNT
jgi:hypothetical protein